MKVNEIIDLAQLQSEEVYDEPTWIGYINLALDDLTPAAYFLRSKEGIPITLTGGNAEIDLLADEDLKRQHQIISVYFTETQPEVKSTRQLRMLSFTNNATEGWKIIDNKLKLQKIKLADAGTCRIDFYSKLGHVSSVEDDIELVAGLPEQFHHLLVDYMCAKSQQKEEELDDKNDFYNDYLMNKRIFTLEQKIKLEPHRRKRYEKMIIQLQAGGGNG